MEVDLALEKKLLEKERGRFVEVLKFFEESEANGLLKPLVCWRSGGFTTSSRAAVKFFAAFRNAMLK